MTANPPTVMQDLLPDLVIQAISAIGDPTSKCPVPNQKVNTRVEIKNKGKGSAGPFVVRVNLDKQLITKGLQSGESIEIIIPGFTSSVIALVDVTSLVVEQDESNNQLSLNLSKPTIEPNCLATANSGNRSGRGSGDFEWAHCKGLGGAVLPGFEIPGLWFSG